MKLLTFNVQHFRNYITRDIDFEIFDRVIKKLDPDVIVLNEVFSGNSIFGDEPKIIADRLNMNYYFGQAISISKGDYGNAILSKYEIINPSTIKIPDPKLKDENVYYESRVIIKCEINNIIILGTHLGLAKSERALGIETLLSLVTKLNNNNQKFAILGDFNMTPNDDLLVPLLKVCKDSVNDYCDDVKYYTFPSINPTQKIDYIFLSNNIDINYYKIINVVASDHFPILVSINN